MTPNIESEQTVTQRKVGEKVVYERDWQLPEFTIKEIRDAIPAHCFKRDTLRSFGHLAHDLVIIAILAYAATFIDALPEAYRYVLWPLYWVAQGIVSTGVWVIAHECGHQAFSPSKFINNSVGWVLHSALLVPYHSWRISHSHHHKATGHLTKDQVFVPSTRSKLDLPPKDQDPEDGMHHSMFDEAPITTLLKFAIMFSGGWQAYLLVNSTGQDYGRWTSHFHTSSPIFEPHQFWDVIVSVVGIIGMLSTLAYSSIVFSPLAVAKYYIIPYMMVNFWLILITFLQHTDPALPHYREAVWNFQRGAALTIDRSYGWLLNYFHHHIADTHVAHHFFSQMPHYHAEEATSHIKKVLGKAYVNDDTPIPIALWRSYTQCKFVEDEGDVVFFQH
ncbi:delta-12 fatty acid desaturase [Jimgerdemannia flammicorona]|uniref:Delta-12 fatty acid desaturase n=1 Tax=Jimgerdemannia flammicorona TaxID=994334 RepID=A0A433DH07_9FUNG|nr:delta-12 fatty acid desaturase [Jimgerdemannia flammicorona]